MSSLLLTVAPVSLLTLNLAHFTSHTIRPQCLFAFNLQIKNFRGFFLTFCSKYDFGGHFFQINVAFRQNPLDWILNFKYDGTCKILKF